MPKKIPKEGIYYKIHVKGPNNNGERDIDYAMWINGEWYKRRYYDEIGNDKGFVDRNSTLGYEYQLIDKSFTVTKFEKMVNQDEEDGGYYDVQ